MKEGRKGGREGGREKGREEGRRGRSKINFKSKKEILTLHQHIIDHDGLHCG